MVIAAPSLHDSTFDRIIAAVHLPPDEQPEAMRAFTRAVSVYVVVAALQGLFGGLRSLSQQLVMQNISYHRGTR